MRIIVAAIGRLKKGPEQELAQRYGDRIAKTGRAIGITTLDTLELTESRAADGSTRKREEADALLGKLPEKTTIIAFDERGKSPSSRKFAATISKCFNGPDANMAFVIGGPDGLDSSLRDRATQLISFGALTMPHQLVRVLVLEQIYRATTILTNHPYHRD